MEIQDLKISQGWLVNYNQFYDMEPTKESVESLDTYFNEDILQFTHERNDRLIDLGWTPENNWDEGSFNLVLYQGDFNGKLLYQLRTKDRGEVIAEINRILSSVTEDRL